MLSFLEEDGVSPAPLREIEAFRERHPLPAGLEGRVTAPLFHYYGREV